MFQRGKGFDLALVVNVFFGFSHTTKRDNIVPEGGVAKKNSDYFSIELISRFNQARE
jgi:hypothetical protein